MLPTKMMPEALKALCDIDHLFDYYRIVDPITKEEFHYEREQVLRRRSQPCYALWQRDGPCRHCVSYHTLLDQQGELKFEYNQEKSFLIYALPYFHQHKRYVLEQAKDVTGSLMLHLLFGENSEELPNLIESLNEWLIHETVTGLYNQRYLYQETARLIDYAKIKPLSLCAVMLDIDEFKQVNDTYGHLSGDEVIRAFAAILRKYVQHTPYLAARVGGDEFMLLCPDLDIAGSQALCQQISGEFCAHPFTGGDRQFFVTFSFGVAKWAEGDDIEQLFGRADAAMYANKRSKKAGQTP